MIKKESAISNGVDSSGNSLESMIKRAKEKQTKLIAEKNKPKQNKYFNKNTVKESSLRNDDTEL